MSVLKTVELQYVDALSDFKNKYVKLDNILQNTIPAFGFPLNLILVAYNYDEHRGKDNLENLLSVIIYRLQTIGNLNSSHFDKVIEKLSKYENNEKFSKVLANDKNMIFQIFDLLSSKKDIDVSFQNFEKNFNDVVNKIKNNTDTIPEIIDNQNKMMNSSNSMHYKIDILTKSLNDNEKYENSLEPDYSEIIQIINKKINSGEELSEKQLHEYVYTLTEIREYDMANKLCDRMLYDNLFNSVAHYNKANILFNQRDYDSAIDHYLKAIFSDSENKKFTTILVTHL